MLRIFGSTVAQNLFGVGKHGFRNGNKALGIAPTKLNAEFFNALQEEICNFILGAGLSLNAEDNSQLFKALKKRGFFYADSQGVSSGGVLSGSAIGQLTNLAGSSSYSLELPDVSVVANGETLSFHTSNNSAGGVIINPPSGQNITMPDGSSLSNLILYRNDTAFFVAISAQEWRLVSGTALLRSLGFIFIKSWTNKSKLLNTTYVNSSNKTICAVCTVTGSAAYVLGKVDGVTVGQNSVLTGTTSLSFTLIVPPGSSYRFESLSTLTGWVESN